MTTSTPIAGARLPPTGVRSRGGPRLVNYFHMNLRENWVPQLEQRLAQWDVVILNPDDVASRGISLESIRRNNPDVVLLVWIPFGQEPHPSMRIAQGLPHEPATQHWYATTTTGETIVPAWGGHLMNPYRGEFAWAHHVAEFVNREYLEGGYDGVLFDILSEGAPTFASSDSPPTNDVNDDGVFNDRDHEAWQAGVLHLLQSVREQHPSAILTGNGGIPWSAQCPYRQYANGDMHENALGNEFGSAKWFSESGSPHGAWDGMLAALENAPAPPPKRVHFLSVDLRQNRSHEEAREATELSTDDLRRMRLGLASSLLVDGAYFGFDRGDSLHGQLWWFDEYDAVLGRPTGPRKRDRFGAASESRAFERGVVVVNPTPAAIHVQLPTPHQDVTTQNEGTAFTIPAGDGRILLSR